MKLVLAIVHDEDGPRVMDELNAKAFSVTKLFSSGGFLRAGNTTLLIGVDESKVKDVIRIIESKSKSRKHDVKTSAKKDGAASSQVVMKGATIFVMDVERYDKV